MKRAWEIEELIENFTFLPNEYSLIGNKTGDTRLGFAVMFKYFQYAAKFPNSKSEIPNPVTEYVGKQVQVSGEILDNYDMNSRTFFNYKAQIRNFFGFREPTNEDTNHVAEWLCKHALYHDVDMDHLKSEAYKCFREMHIEPPTPDIVDRLVKSTIYAYYGGKDSDRAYHKLTVTFQYMTQMLVLPLIAFSIYVLRCV